ncbi:MAG TPA: restriction endonuclease [candidate division Zixibacteria bacterium]|nr:restriction endonuclease [candidate division Zixibacteria bacterium]
MYPNNGDEKSNLYDLAVEFFKQMNFQVREDVNLLGSSGKRHHFQMIVKVDSDVLINEIVVQIVDWNRAVGVDRLIRFERILTDLNNRKGMIISNSFSNSAINFGKRRGLILYSRDELYISLD